MAAIHILEADAVRNFASLLAHVCAGAEVVIESDVAPIAVLRTPAPPRRSIEECIALLPEDSTATIDEDFARDVREAVGYGFTGYPNEPPFDSFCWPNPS
jgi:antitoxin (DNA-binding transcriptional repressor) of toxin-antitoxin stability system